MVIHYIYFEPPKRKLSPPRTTTSAPRWRLPGGDGSIFQPIQDFIATGNRSANKPNNSGYEYGIVLAYNNDNAVLKADSALYNMRDPRLGTYSSAKSMSRLIPQIMEAIT